MSVYQTDIVWMIPPAYTYVSACASERVVYLSIGLLHKMKFK